MAIFTYYEINNLNIINYGTKILKLFLMVQVSMKK